MNPLIITTEERFVIYATVDDSTYRTLTAGDYTSGVYTFQHARVIIRWSDQPEGSKGIGALAACGPAGALLSPPAPSMRVPGHTLRQVWCLSDEAAAAWAAL